MVVSSGVQILPPGVDNDDKPDKIENTGDELELVI